MNHKLLLATAQKLCTAGKGILAADESTGTIGKRFVSIKVENTLTNRIHYRSLLFKTPNLSDYISGVITYEETLETRGDETGEPLVKPLLDQGIVVGIKTDKGVKPLAGTDGETVTQGIDDLDQRCQRYFALGARFAKWRAVLKIGSSSPSPLAISQNAETLARYASISQQHGLVPIVEPEILMDGNHDLETSYQKTVEVLSVVYRKLVEHRVFLEGTLLKPNMVRAGAANTQQYTSHQIATMTVGALQQAVPVAVPGIFFLSGGMSELEASESLNQINLVAGKKPWYLSFSYGRALQHSVLQVWQGLGSNREQAQQALRRRARANGLASLGKYRSAEGSERDSKPGIDQVGVDLHQDSYLY